MPRPKKPICKKCQAARQVLARPGWPLQGDFRSDFTATVPAEEDRGMTADQLPTFTLTPDILRLRPYLQKLVEAYFTQVRADRPTPAFMTVPAPQDPDECEQFEKFMRIWRKMRQDANLPPVRLHLDHGQSLQ
jgi:hypothetical protein